MLYILQICKKKKVAPQKMENTADKRLIGKIKLKIIAKRTQSGN